MKVQSLRMNKGDIEQKEQKENENKKVLEILQVMDTDECEKESGLNKNEGQRVEENQRNKVKEQDRDERGGVQPRRRSCITKKPLADITNEQGKPRMRGKRKLTSDREDL